MNTFNYLFLILMVGMISCTHAEEENEDKPGTEESKTNELPELSVYNLPSEWTNQDGENIQLADLRGNVLAVVMIYTSCQAACPRLVADMRHIEKQVPDKINEEVKYVFVSIDPETDTPERLHAFAEENLMADDQWVFLRGTEEDTREFAAILGMGYRRISPIDFSHSNIISVFNKEGVLEYQKEGLGTDDSETVAAIKELAK